MKQPKKFTRGQKVKMSKKGLDIEKYFLISFNNLEFTIQHKESGEKKTLKY